MLQVQAVEPNLLLVAKKIFALQWSQDFVMVGGTNAALQLGHRSSVDIDLFTNKEIRFDKLSFGITQEFDVSEADIVKQEDGLTAYVNGGLKVDFFQWHVPINLPLVVDGGLRLANLLDVAALKIEAIVQRREKKDYIDLYFIFKELDPMKCLNHFHKVDKYCSSKSVSFALEETSAAVTNDSRMPDMLKPVTWPDIDTSLKMINRAYTKTKLREKDQGMSL